MDRSKWDPRSLENYDEEGNLKESLMLSPTSFPKERFTKEGKRYYYTRKNEEGVIEPITSGGVAETIKSLTPLVDMVNPIKGITNHLFKDVTTERSDSTDWSLKDLAYPLNVPFGGKRQGNLSDWTFTTWATNQALSQISAVGKAGQALKGKYFYRPPVKPPINITPKSSTQTNVENKGIIPKYSGGKIVRQHTQKAGFAGPEGEPLVRLDFTPASIFQMDANPTLLKDTSSDIAKFNTIYTGETRTSEVYRETVLSDKPAAIEYRTLIKKYEDINKDAPTITVGKKQEVLKVTPASLEDFQADVLRLKELKTELGLPFPGVFNKELGAFVKDGQRYRLGSKGYLKSQGGSGLRIQKQQQIPTTEQFDPLKPKWGSFMNSLRQEYVRQAGLKKPEKDHMVRLENQLAILGKGLDKDNNFINRPPEFMNKVAGELHKRGYSLGDQNLNFLQMSEEAHRTGFYSRHRISQELTDAEFPHSYLEADQIQTKLKDGSEKWLDVEVLDFDKGTFRLKDGDNVVPNKLIKSKGNYKFAGKIYEKGQRQGLSLTTRMILASIDNPQDVAAAYMMFATDAGAHEIMTGIQTAASFIYDDASQLDPLTLEIREKNIPNMIKFLDYALETPQFKGDKVYTDLRNRFVNRLELNRREYGEQLRQRGS
jgi:hypothetical protein